MTFYKLSHEEAVSLMSSLRYSELKVILYLKTISPYGRDVEINCSEVGEMLGLDRRTVGRCLRVLHDRGLLRELEISTALVTVAPYPVGGGSGDPTPGSGDPTPGSGDPTPGSGDPTPGSGDPKAIAETPSAQVIPDPLDQIRSEDHLERSDQEEEERKISYGAIDPLYREFLSTKARRLPDRPNNFNGWIVAMAKKGTYWEEWQGICTRKSVPQPIAVVDQKMNAQDYWRQVLERQNAT